MPYPHNLLEEAKSRLTLRNHELLGNQVSWPIGESFQAGSQSSSFHEPRFGAERKIQDGSLVESNPHNIPGELSVVGPPGL